MSGLVVVERKSREPTSSAYLLPSGKRFSPVLASLAPDTIGVLLGVELDIPNDSRSAITRPWCLRVRILAARSRLTFMPMKSLTTFMSRTSNVADTEFLTA